MILQKTFVSYVFVGRQSRNDGHLEKYMVHEHHPAIVSREKFERANESVTIYSPAQQEIAWWPPQKYMMRPDCAKLEFRHIWANPVRFSTARDGNQRVRLERLCIYWWGQEVHAREHPHLGVNGRENNLYLGGWKLQIHSFQKQENRASKVFLRNSILSWHKNLAIRSCWFIQGLLGINTSRFSTIFEKWNIYYGVSKK